MSLRTLIAKIMGQGDATAQAVGVVVERAGGRVVRDRGDFDDARRQQLLRLVRILHKAGEVARETHATSHWWQNTGKVPVVLLSFDIQHDPNDKHM